MHAGAAVGFMAKSAPGWLVPGLALLTLVLWERRLRELCRWELYAGLLLQALIIVPWLLAVAHTAEGAAALRTLFWNNIVGRFTHVAAPAALDYTSGHQNRPGKYLIELPFYLLPWTLVGARSAGAGGGAGTRRRRRGHGRGDSRSARACPGSRCCRSRRPRAMCTPRRCSSGSRCSPALWLPLAQARAEPPRPLVRRRDPGARRPGRLVPSWPHWRCWPGWASLPHPRAPAAALGVLLFAVPALLHSARAQRRGELRESLLRSYAAYAAALCLSAILVFPVIDRAQDLRSLARRVRADTAQRPLALLDPDETTIAIIDHGFTRAVHGPQ